MDGFVISMISVIGFGAAVVAAFIVLWPSLNEIARWLEVKTCILTGSRPK